MPDEVRSWSIHERTRRKGLKWRVCPFGSVSRLRSAESPGSLLLFVAGEPELTPGIRESGVGLAPRFAGLVFATGLIPPPPRPPVEESPQGRNASDQPPLTDSRPWHLAPAQMASLQVVLDAAKRQRRGVFVVDVNRPGVYQSLVERHVGPDDVLPLLVRPDGARLEGQESFDPARVRRFIAGR